MSPTFLRRTFATALALSVLALPAFAAPVPKVGPSLNVEKYLLDDTDGVLVVNVKQIMASPAYKKAFQKQFADLLARPEVQTYLKDAGFDPLKDVDRVVVCMGKSCHADNFEAGREDGPFILFQGKFDAAKGKAKLAALAKDQPDHFVGIDAPGGQKIYRLGKNNAPFLAQLDANNVAIAGKKAHVLEALVKASGKKQTKFVHKEVAAQLKKLKPDVAVQGFALEQMVMNTRYESIDNGMGKRISKARQVTMADNGFKGATLEIAVKDEARGNVAFVVKDKAQVKKHSDDFTKGLEQARMQIAREVARDAKLAPVARFLAGVSIRTVGQTITMEGKADTDMAQAMFDAMFMGRAGGK